MNLRKQDVLTGGTYGIGKATARAFAKEGANVVVSGRRVAEGRGGGREITSVGGGALFVQTDVAPEDDIVALVEKTAHLRCSAHRLRRRSALPPPTSFAGNIVSNALAGPPGHDIVLDAHWADVPDSNLIRWVGAPAEIHTLRRARRGCAACHRHEARPTTMVCEYFLLAHPA